MNKLAEAYSTIEKIYIAFQEGVLTPRETVDELAKKQTKKPWHTKEWKAIREKRIKDSCKQCGKSEPPMVLQHMWHPDKLSHTIQNITRKYEYEYSKENPCPTPVAPAPQDIREGCPNCGRFSGFNFRKTHQNWRCSNCRTEFDELVEIPVLSNEQYEAYDAERKHLEAQWREQFITEHEDIILSEALTVGYEQHKRYISCIDTVTFCKKCAYMWDTNKKKMCEKCGNWIPNYMTYESCFNCLEEGFGFDRHVERLYAMYDDDKRIS